MKKLLPLLIFACCAMTTFAQKTSVPFTKGVNTFIPFFRDNATMDKMPSLNVYDEDDFICLKSMGVDVVRLAVYFPYLMEPAFTGTVNETVLQKIDEVCDWAEKNQIYLIIDNHGMGGADYGTKTAAELQEHLEKLWPVIAKRYADRSQYIMYEIMNEPADPLTTSQWQKVQEVIIEKIREYDKKHTIIVTGVNWSTIDYLTQIKPYKDSNIIYTFHFYEPNLFTQQYESFSEELQGTDGIPFPYDKSKMPKIKAQEGTWFKELYSTYAKDGNEKYLETRIKKISDWAKKNKVNIFCGEIGSGNPVNHSDRVVYNKALSSVLQKYKVPYCVWTMDVANGFMQNEKRGMIFPDDIDADIVESYGFTMPDSSAFEKTNTVIRTFPNKPFILNDGITGKWVETLFYGNVKNSYVNDGHADCILVTYDTETKYSGCIIYPPDLIKESIIKNHSSLVLSLSVKFTEASQSFKIHFKDTDKGSSLLPWKSSYVVQASKNSVGKWITVEIPLSKTKEIDGTFSDVEQKWFDSEGEFDWARFDSIYFDFDNYDSMTGNVYIDDIVIMKK
ncbi:MAG: glycoside hydrolase family 5 protein [Treponema sp.]|nr:glycoside hydrolase family 5 protein [Treponema sp.]